MGNNKELLQRKSTRLKCFDYGTTGAYFITICTGNRRTILSKIVGDGVLDVPHNVELLPCGIIADKYINQMDGFYDDISVDQYIIMPNHIHIILIVSENGSSGTPTPTSQNSTVSRFVSNFKRYCNKEIGQNIWQRGFYDHVVRNRKDYEQIKKYIYENPSKWFYDELYIDEK